LRNKYGARKVRDDGYLFDSKAEHLRYCELKVLQKAGEISELEVHPKYSIELNGHHICTVILDFRYRDSHGTVIEDVKGKDLALSRLKRKLVEAQHGIEVVLIRKRA